MSLESKLTVQCVKLFKKIQKDYDGFFFQKISDRYASGLPDFYLCYFGKSIWIELKAKDETPKPIQRYTMTKLKNAGALVLWTDEFKEVQAFMEQILRFEVPVP